MNVRIPNMVRTYLVTTVYLCVAVTLIVVLQVADLVQAREFAHQSPPLPAPAVPADGSPLTPPCPTVPIPTTPQE